MTEALIVVDFQNDFARADGALAVPHGEEIAPRLGALTHDPRYALVIATRDWHPAQHGSFKAQGGPWPEHCVQGSVGAELDAKLDRGGIDVVIDKGQSLETDGYSAFENPQLERTLQERGIDAVTVVGLATDYCVLNTARDALARELTVTLDTSAVRAVDARPGDGERALAQLRELGARVVDLSKS